MALKNFPIDFVRQIIDQALLEEHIKNPNYFGGKNQVSLMSFYEQLLSQEQVDRFTNVYRDLTEQQNRTGLIMNGTIIAPENPTITNIHSALVVPMSFTCSFRVHVKDRDMALETINNVIARLKGRKVDIAETNVGELIMVGTIANNVEGTPEIKVGDFLVPLYESSSDAENLLDYYEETLGFVQEDTDFVQYYYVGYQTTLDETKLGVIIWNESTDENDEDTSSFELITDEQIAENERQYPYILFPKPHDYFTPYKVSLSFESIRCDEPRNLNGDEYCVISFGGSATLVSKSIMLGNDLVKLGIAKVEVKGPNGGWTNDEPTIYWLEPLEIPSGGSIETQANQLLSNKFLTNSHADSLTISNQYTFLIDTSIDLISHWVMFARYGIQGTSDGDYSNGVCPNMIYEVTELGSSWGEVLPVTFRTKIVESIDIENTESDTLTITIPFQVQGDND